MKLVIAIPALNEELAIESIIQRTLAARKTIMKQCDLDAVQVIVVSDGSTDHTVEIASRYLNEIRLIVFEHNRGYGAAIQAAWNDSDAELMGFLDADGTCDPEFFVQLCRAILEEKADIALGSRVHSESRMPRIRRVGNALFAMLLTALSTQRVCDSASGMRVVRRSSLPDLLPLPDGLDFTPAMSARAILRGGIKTTELPMPYLEREGQSKLRVWKDGVRFLNTILGTALLYRPVRPMALAGIAMVLAAAVLMAEPSLYWARNHSIPNWMIYRFVVAHLLSTTGLLLMSVGYLCGLISRISILRQPLVAMRSDWHFRLISHRLFWAIPLSELAAGGTLVLPSAIELARSGHTYLQWSRFIGMSFLAETAAILVTLKIGVHAVNLMAEQVAYLRNRAASSAAATPSHSHISGTRAPSHNDTVCQPSKTVASVRQQ